MDILIIPTLYRPRGKHMEDTHESKASPKDKSSTIGGNHMNIHVQVCLIILYLHLFNIP